MGGGGHIVPRQFWNLYCEFFCFANPPYYSLTFHLLLCYLWWNFDFGQKMHTRAPGGGPKNQTPQIFVFEKWQIKLCLPNTSQYQKVIKTKNLYLDNIFLECGLRFDLRSIFWSPDPNLWFFPFSVDFTLWNSQKLCSAVCCMWDCKFLQEWLEIFSRASLIYTITIYKIKITHIFLWGPLNTD